MAALEFNEKDFELFGPDVLETDDIFSLGGTPKNQTAAMAAMNQSSVSLPAVVQRSMHPGPVVSATSSEDMMIPSGSASVASTQSQQRKRRAEDGANRSEKLYKQRADDDASDALPSFVSVTSSTAPRKKRTPAASAAPLPEGVRLIPDFYAVLGDKQSGGRGRTTTATTTLRDVKEWYKEKKPIYRDEGRLHALMDDALERYFSAVAAKFPDEFPTTLEERKKTIIIYCSKEALQSGRVAEPNCFTYEPGKPAKFGLATVPAAISFFLESRDAPSLPSVVRKLRRDFDSLNSQEGAAPQAMLAHFEGLLQFCEMQLQAAASQEMAQKLLDKLNLIPALREQWKFLKEHAAANGKHVGGGRSVASAKSRSSNQDADSDPKKTEISRKEQGKRIARNRKSAAQRMKARQPHDYRSFHNSGSFNQGPFVTMQPQADDDSECGSNWSSSYCSGHPSVVSEQSRSPYGGRPSIDDESLTDVDGWQAGQSQMDRDDDDGSYQAGNEINVMNNFHDSASAASAVSSVTAATAMLRMDEEERNAVMNNNSNNSHGYYGGGEQDHSWNQQALSRLRLRNDDSSYNQGMDNSGNKGFNIGIPSGNDSVASASSRSRNGTSSRRARAIRQQRLRGNYQTVGPSMQTPNGPSAPMQPLSNIYHVTAISVVDPHGDHGLYTGSISNESGMPHGLGRFEFLRGGRWYEGNWVHGHWTGRGRLSNGDGSHYEGFFQDDLKHGEGTMVWGDGRIFDGVYKYGQMSWGKMQFTDGGVYCGNFVDGRQHGKGKMVFPDGSKYEGDFVSGNFHGQGKMVWTDGGYYEGEWQNGQIQGVGKEVRADGSVRHSGTWKSGAPVR